MGFFYIESYLNHNMVVDLCGQKLSRKLLGRGWKTGQTIVVHQEDVSSSVVDVKLFTSGGEAESDSHIGIIGICACCHD